MRLELDSINKGVKVLDTIGSRLSGDPKRDVSALSMSFASSVKVTGPPQNALPISSAASQMLLIRPMRTGRKRRVCLPS